MVAYAIKLVKPYLPTFDMADFFYRMGLVGLGGATLALLAFVKSTSVGQLGATPLLVFYTLFVTAFELSRIIGALFYERAMRSFLVIPWI